MLPPEHFLVAFIPLLVYVLVRDKQLPSLRFVAVVFLGTQFPDLIDKPLAHQFGVLPSGRVFMHSLPTAIPVLLIIGLYGWKTNRLRLSSAFIFSHLSHLLADNYRLLIQSKPQIPADLLWPLTQPIARPVAPYWAGARGINVRLWTIFSMIVLSISVCILIVDILEQFSIPKR